MIVDVYSVEDFIVYLAGPDKPHRSMVHIEQDSTSINEVKSKLSAVLGVIMDVIGEEDGVEFVAEQYQVRAVIDCGYAYTDGDGGEGPNRYRDIHSIMKRVCTEKGWRLLPGQLTI